MVEPAEIVSLDELEARRDGWGRIVATSGGYDPLHPGHVSCLLAAASLGDTLVVIVNGDGFLRAKKGRPFQDLQARCRVVAAVRGVGVVVPFESADDDTVREVLLRLRPHVFAKGGDRTDPTNIPEWPLCRELGVEIKTGVGADKAWSSSDLLEEWGEYWASRRRSV